MAIRSYPQVYQLDHRAVADLFDGEIVVSEKLDGSQFSLGVIDGALECRSHGQQIVLDAPGIFEKAVATARELQPLLRPSWVYRCEYLPKQRQVALSYGRVPKKFLALYDICTGLEEYAPPEVVKEWGGILGLDVAPYFYVGPGDGIAKAQLVAFLENESVLGGVKVEGVVVKNPGRFGLDKKALMGKLVREEFVELHDKAWRGDNPRGKDIIEGLGEKYRSEARWMKAIQHLAEAGQLQNAPQDIGPLLREIPADILKEEEDAIKAALFKWAWPQISRKAVAGFPAWYKERVTLPDLGMAEKEGE